MKHALLLLALILFLASLALAAPWAEKEEVEERLANFRGDRREKRQAPQDPSQDPTQGPAQGSPCTGRRCGTESVPAGRRGKVIIQEGWYDREFHYHFPRGYHAGSDADDDD